MTNFSKAKAIEVAQAATIDTVNSSKSLPKPTADSSSGNSSSSTTTSPSRSASIYESPGKRAERTFTTYVLTTPKTKNTCIRFDTPTTISGTATRKSNSATESVQAAATNTHDSRSESSIATLGNLSERSKIASESDFHNEDGSGDDDGSISPTNPSNETETDTKRRMKAIGENERGDLVEDIDKKRRKTSKLEASRVKLESKETE